MTFFIVSLRDTIDKDSRRMKDRANARCDFVHHIAARYDMRRMRNRANARCDFVHRIATRYDR